MRRLKKPALNREGRLSLKRQRIGDPSLTEGDLRKIARGAFPKAHQLIREVCAVQRDLLTTPIPSVAETCVHCVLPVRIIEVVRVTGFTSRKIYFGSPRDSAVEIRVRTVPNSAGR